MRAIVVGSGIAGASTGYQLARRGVEVVVVDEERPGVATEAGAGIVCPWTSRAGEDHYRWASVAATFYPTLIEWLAEDGVADSSYEVVGGLVVSADQGELDDAHARVVGRAATEAGEVRRLEPTGARKLFPVPAPPSVRSTSQAARGSTAVDYVARCWPPRRGTVQPWLTGGHPWLRYPSARAVRRRRCASGERSSRRTRS